MKENPRWLDIPWVKKQVQEWLDIKSGDIKNELNNLQKDVVIKKLSELDFSWFNKRGTVEKSAAHIVLVQKALNLINGNDSLTVDGIYGTATRDAIQVFQDSDKWGNKITKDGIPWNNTKNKLIAALNDSAPAAPTQDATSEAPVQKLNKAKTALTSELNKLGVTVSYKTPETDGRVFTENFIIWGRTFNLGISWDWTKYVAFEWKNRQGFWLKDWKWNGKTSDHTSAEGQWQELSSIINALPKPAKVAEWLERYKEKVEMKWDLKLTPIIFNNEPKIYFKVEKSEQDVKKPADQQYIRLEKADIEASKRVTYQNVTVAGKEYASITLTPSVGTDGNLVINVTSVLKPTTNTSSTLTLENHSKKDAILESIKGIPWLEKATLTWLGFKINNQEMTLPDGLSWTDTSKKDAVKLTDWYEVKDWKIQKLMKPNWGVNDSAPVKDLKV